jgi:hypothetical protein
MAAVAVLLSHMDRNAVATAIEEDGGGGGRHASFFVLLI